MFAKSVFDTAGCHTHIFTLGEIFAVRLGKPLIVDTVCSITRYCLLDTVLVARPCPSDTCSVVALPPGASLWVPLFSLWFLLSGYSFDLQRSLLIFVGYLVWIRKNS